METNGQGRKDDLLGGGLKVVPDIAALLQETFQGPLSCNDELTKQ